MNPWLGNVYDNSLPWRSNAYHLSARFKVLDGAFEVEGLQLNYIEIAAGGRILPHAQDYSEWYFCIEGEGIFQCDEVKTPFKMGDTFIALRHQVRAITNSTDGTVRLLSMQARNRPLSLMTVLRSLMR